MAELKKITSFQTFSDMRAQDAAMKLAEETVAKKEALKAKFASVIDELEAVDNIDFNIQSLEEGNAFIYAAAKARQEGKDEFEFNGKKYKVTLKKDTGLKESEIVEEVNEGKRENGKVVTAWKKTGVTDLASIAKIYADAMEDANFHQEMSTSKAIGSASKAKAKELGDKYSDISSAAGWSGYAIANGTVQYLNHIGEEGAASKLLKAITKYDLNESVELPSELELEEGNAFGDAVRKAKEAGEKEFEFEGETYKVEENEEVNEGEKDEVTAMELYTQVAGPEGEYSEDELAKADDKTFAKIVADAGHKGSKAKKITDEFKKIATMESVLFEATVEMDAMDPDDKDFLKFLKKNKVKIAKKEMSGPGGGTPVVTMQGKRKDLEAVLADCDYGWCDEDLAEYIEEAVVYEAAGDFAGWIAIDHKGTRLEIKADEAKDLWAAKKLAIAKLRVPKSKEGLLAIAPAVEESVEVNEGRISYPKGKQYRVSARFEDRDDQNTFAETYDLGKQSSNYARAFANEEELVEIVKDLKNIYGLQNKAITLHIKGKNGDYDFWKIDSQNLKRHLSSDLLSKLSEIVSESVVNEAEVKSAEDFKEYAFSVLQKAFGDDFDEAKAQEVVDGLVSKYGEDYGAMVGALQSSLAESVEVDEKKADGTISDDEDERREALMAEVESAMDQLLSKIKADAEDIGGSFRSPGIMYDAKKIMDNKLKKFK